MASRPAASAEPGSAMPFQRSAGSARLGGLLRHRARGRQRHDLVVGGGRGIARGIRIVGRPFAPGALAEHAAQAQENEHRERQENDGVNVEHVVACSRGGNRCGTGPAVADARHACPSQRYNVSTRLRPSRGASVDTAGRIPPRPDLRRSAPPRQPRRRQEITRHGKMGHHCHPAAAGRRNRRILPGGGGHRLALGLCPDAHDLARGMCWCCAGPAAGGSPASGSPSPDSDITGIEANTGGFLTVLAGLLLLLPGLPDRPDRRAAADRARCGVVRPRPSGAWSAGADRGRNARDRSCARRMAAGARPRNRATARSADRD